LIYLFTDFGFNGPYVGQIKTVLYEQAVDAKVIDLMHDAPVFNSRAAAHFLAASVLSLATKSIVLGVVDPGVGSARKGVALYADSRWYVGPDNGLFDVIASRASEFQWYEITYKNMNASCSFHGRDVFSPVAAMLHNRIELSEFLLPIKTHNQTQADDLFEVIYIDHFGNLMTGIRALNFELSKQLVIDGTNISYAHIFSDVKKGEAFYYENSQGLLEIAVNSGSAEKVFGAAIGDVIDVLLK